MKILRFPLCDSNGVISDRAKLAVGKLTAGQSFRISYPNEAGVDISMDVHLMGEFCFVPEEIPDHVVTDIASQLTPLVESPEEAYKRFFSGVFKVAGINLA